MHLILLNTILLVIRFVGEEEEEKSWLVIKLPLQLFRQLEKLNTPLAFGEPVPSSGENMATPFEKRGIWIPFLSLT